MKKLFALAFVALSLMTSCSSDDSVSVTEEKLAKKWYFKSSKANGQTEVYEHLPCAKDYIEFLADGSYKENYVEQCSPLSTTIDTGNWILEGNTISISAEGNLFDAKVNKISSSEMQLTVVADEDGDGDEEKIITTFTSM